MMNKTNVIYILVFSLVVASVWGSVANRKNVVLEKNLEDMEAKLQQITAQSNLEREQVLGRTADLQVKVAEKDKQLGKARQELVALRKETQALESKLSGCNATISELQQEKKTLQKQVHEARAELAAVKKKEAAAENTPVAPVSKKAEANQTAAPETAKGGGDKENQVIRNQLRDAEATIAGLQQKFTACSAQLLGLEKMVKEKDDAMSETAQEIDRLRINLDVLLARISDQQDDLQEMREENSQLLKAVAAKNEEIADLQEELTLQPVQE